jgi:hypothetical protein
MSKVCVPVREFPSARLTMDSPLEAQGLLMILRYCVLRLMFSLTSNHSLFGHCCPFFLDLLKDLFFIQVMNEQLVYRKRKKKDYEKNDK